jgi:diguanylate cyclase (GGDEF)-like protein
LRYEEQSQSGIRRINIGKDRLPDFRSWLELLYSQPRQDLAIQAFFAGLSQIEQDFRAVYFKYIPQRRTLMAAYWHKFEDHEVRSIGLDFNELDPNFRSESLREPNKLELLRELASLVFKADDYRWDCHVVLGEVQGLFLILPQESSGAAMDWDLIESYMSALQRHSELLELEKRLHSNSLRDPGTEVLNRHTLLRQVSEEVSRARRVELPTSLLILCLDQYFELKDSLGSEETEVLLRALARIFIKHSRVNDVIGRVGTEQFALVLPHTSLEGAMIKADRLRKIVEAADFTKIIKSVGKLTISVAVSEYPSLCRDADELFQTADEALFELKSHTANKITQAKAPKDFEPDFAVEKGS